MADSVGWRPTGKGPSLRDPVRGHSDCRTDGHWGSSERDAARSPSLLNLSLVGWEKGLTKFNEFSYLRRTVFCPTNFRVCDTRHNHDRRSNVRRKLTSRAIGRRGMITGHNAGSLAWSRRPFLEREVACPPSSSSRTKPSADGRSQLEGVESSVRRSHGRSRRLSRTSEPRAQLQRPLPSRMNRTWLHPALQDESHPAAADLYILFIFSIFP